MNTLVRVLNYGREEVVSRKIIGRTSQSRYDARSWPDQENPIEYHVSQLSPELFLVHQRRALVVLWYVIGNIEKCNLTKSVAAPQQPVLVPRRQVEDCAQLLSQPMNNKYFRFPSYFSCPEYAL